MSAACHFADEEVTMKFSAPAKENHFALWNWLAKNPEENRIDWPGWETMQRLFGVPRAGQKVEIRTGEI